MKNNTVFKILLMLAPLQCWDFIPQWLILVFCALLFVNIFTTINQFIFIPIILGCSYLTIKEFGYNLQPESAVSFLNLVLLMKFLSYKTEKQTHYILGFLWIGTFALFNTNIYYLFYLVFGLVLIIYMYPLKMDEPFSFDNLKLDKKFIFAILKALPLITLLFFIFPRFYGFFPSANNAIEGKIGYSTKINNSSINNLQLNSQIAFYAELKETIQPDTLYWRGRVHTQTDGYNWKKKDRLVERNKVTNSNYGTRLNYKLKYEQDFNGDIILLDSPVTILNANLRYYEQKKYKTFHTYQKKKKVTLNAQSIIGGDLIQSNIDKELYLQLPQFRPNILKKINQQFKNLSAPEIIKKFSEYIRKEKFTYSLNPGRMSTMAQFLTKKIGYCTHYASFLGVIFRMNNIPSRLVSGFQGAQINEVGNYYIITSNDAHAWVEYYHDKKWKRVDPTGFISPNRIIQGGNQFLTQSATTRNRTQLFRSFEGIRKYFNYINYRLALFMDNFDRESQSDIAKLFKLNLKQFYILGFALIMLVSGILLRSRLKKEKINKDKIDVLFDAFHKKALQNNIQISPSETIKDIQLKLIQEHPKNKEIINFLEAYQKSRYSKEKNTDELTHLLDQI